MIFRITHLLIIVGLALSIAGGVKAIPTNKAAEISDGRSLRKGAAILFLIGYIVNLGLAVLAFLRIRDAWDGDRKIIYAAVASMPFLFVRLIYTVIVSFDTTSSTFNAFSPNIYAQAFMQITMEFIVFGIYLAAGLTVPSTKEAPRIHEESHGLVGGLLARRSGRAFRKDTERNAAYGDAEMGTIPAQRTH
jgi:hypothetical protein